MKKEQLKLLKQFAEKKILTGVDGGLRRAVASLLSETGHNVEALELPSLRKKINTILRFLEEDGKLHIRGGTLVLDDESKEPGFLYLRVKDKRLTKEEIILQIGSDVAWMLLIEHARKMLPEEFRIMTDSLE